MPNLLDIINRAKGEQIDSYSGFVAIDGRGSIYISWYKKLKNISVDGIVDPYTLNLLQRLLAI